MHKGRLEAFSDGVLAVAITLLVLDLHDDTSKSAATLARQLSNEWPAFVAYVVSFFIIGVIWVNHHAIFALAARVDRLMMFYNLLLLLWVTAIPFTTSTLAGFEGKSTADSRWAVLLYGISSEGMAISFALILRHLLRNGLTHRKVTPAEARTAVRRYSLGAVVFPVITVIGLFSVPVMFVLYIAVVSYYIIDQTPILPDEKTEAIAAEEGEATA
jgi:uncharacterized membrane protein